MKSAIYLITLLILGFGPAAFGQAPAAATAAEAGSSFPEIMTYVLLAAGGLLFVVSMVYFIRVNQFLYKRVLTLQAQQSGIILPEATAQAGSEPAADDFWTRMRKRYWENAVPQEREHEIMTAHGFDGIHELDNSLPPWWVNMFILTVIWAGLYMFYFHFGGSGPSSAEEYEREIEQAKKEQAIALAGKADAVDETTVIALTEASALADGESIFKASCAACHGQLGEGLVGPNFTDDYWIHGGGVKNIFKTIKYGVPDKGMISWQSQLKPSDMQKVSSYILTLRGTNPPNPKAPQGEIWTEAASDSTKIAGGN